MSWMIYLLLFALGASLGSFMNVVILRLPHRTSVVKPASHCPSCLKPLRWYHNIPILSWLALRGKCAYCAAPISMQYPAIELLSGIIMVLLVMKMGLALASVGIALVFLLLLAMSVIDARYHEAPDSLNLLALTLAIASVYSLPMLVIHLQDALLFAGGFALLRFYVSYMAGQEAMGEADIMIAATMGALLGIPLGLAAIFLSALLALPFMLFLRWFNKETHPVLPYIPFLTLATWIVFMFDTTVMQLIGALYA